MKRSVAFVCTLALLLGMIVPGVAAADNTCPCCGAANVTWTNFTADTVPEPGVHYRLTGKVEKSGQWTVETAGTYCIDLAGQTLQTNSRAFIAGSNSTKPAVILNLMDSSAGQTGVIKGSGSTNAAWSAGVLYSCTNATINIYGGTVTTTDVNTPSAGKGGVVTAQGNFNMYGGTIIGGTAQTYGGAISVQSSSVFTMTGGTIKSGTAPLAPCVYVGSSAKVILSGDAKVDNIYIDGTPKDRLTISGVYTGSVELSAKNEIVAGDTIAAAKDADISGASVSVAGKPLAASVSGTSVVVGEGSWCEACRKNVVWQTVTASQLATMSEKKQAFTAGHYRICENVVAGQMTFLFDGTVCLDLNGYSYTGNSRAFTLGNAADGFKPVLNIMDSSKEKTGVLQAHGGNNYTAGMIYAHKDSVLNIYGGTLRLAAGGSAKLGAVIATWAGSAVNLYDGKILGGTATSQGGAIFLRNNSTLNVTGGSICSGTAATAGDCVYVENGGIVKLSGNGSVEELYFAGSSADKLTITGNYTGNVGLKYATIPAAGADIGNCADATVGKENITIAGIRFFGAVSGVNLVVKTLTGASVTNEAGTSYYDTLAAALLAAKKGDVVKLLESAATAETPDGIVLDLNGWNVTSLTASGTVYVKDSATDDYTVEDVAGYGKIAAASGDVKPCNGYMPLEENGLSLHKYVLKIFKVNLRPGKTGIYYTADISVNEEILKKLENYGIAVSINTEAPALDDAKSLYTTGTNSVLISGIMDGADSDALNAATLIYGRPYITFTDGTVLYGSTVSASLQQVTQAVDEKNWGKLSLVQNRALMTMYGTYSAAMADWEIANIAASAAKKQAAADDGVLKAIVIGNSASVDATALLAGIFKTEAPDQEFVLGCMYESGCSVVGHVGFLQANAPAYTYYKNTGSDINGAWTLHKDSTLEDGLADQNWDVVIFQELHTVSGLAATFENDNLETLITYVVNTVGYEPQLDWHSVGIIPEIPKAYADYVMSLEGDDGGGTDAGENEGWEDDGTSQPEDLAWIFDIARPGYPVTWAKNYIKNFNNDAQTMYDAICDVAVNHIMPSELYSFDDVIPGGSVIQYARNMGMTDRDLFRDYAHKSDYGRVLIGYVWYASLMDITEFAELKYTTVPAQMRQKKFVQYGDLVLSEEQYNMALAAINYALANPYDSPTPVE